MAARRLRVVSARLVCAAVMGTLGVAGCSSSQSTTSKPDRMPGAIAAELKSHPVDANIRAIIVQVAGRSRFERYYSASAQQSRSSYSVTKSVMSTLIGIAIDEGRLRLDQRLSQLLPRYATVMKPSVARVTLRQLLTMTAGFPDADQNAEQQDKLAASRDWTRFILAHQVMPAGRQFHYSNYSAHLLSPILAQATGQSVLAYARAELFDPLGIVTRPALEPLFVPKNLPAYGRAQFAWPVDPQGFHVGDGWIKLRPRDMVTLGELFLHQGRWGHRQIVSARWVGQAAIAQTGTQFDAHYSSYFNPSGYGYMWWVEAAGGTPAFYAQGSGGQLIEVVPRRQLVIVVSTDLDLTHPYASTVDRDDLQRLVEAIVAAV
jgi:CubicO group peptidase (beta-lactamase class C family)